ncbi:L,D-transpeptidase family protein [Streptomyces marianii]|uniref:Murein L,D-transpeptidase n=1 Tax=Streptomyces marianii TaxID=1817406 RepID=A0A5R9E7D1_9ACTN|nr:L,D-transpeptidase family protein [Streptomyces marianii]TLQ44144.1 murein L,D-transpeptidase [Streptomyces marianii]
MSVAAVALAAGCTSQGAGGGGAEPPAAPAGPAGPPKAPSATATAVPAADDAKPPAPSPSPSTPDARTAEPRVLMTEGTETEQVRELQARLRQIGHFHRSPTAFYGSMTAKAVSGFQRKRGLAATGSVDETTWRRLLGATRTPTADELRPATTNALDEPDPRCLTGRVLCISKESRTLAWMIDGTVVAAMDVRFGSENTPTREGTFSVGWKAEEWESTLYHTPMPYAMFFSGGQAVHYSSDFAARGYNGASHGCVNVRDKKKIASVFGQVKVGDKVVVHW